MLADEPFIVPLPAKAGEPDAVDTLRDPVLRTVLITDELSAGIVAGAVTPGNPVTPVHVPTGNAIAGPGLGAAVEEGGVLVEVEPALEVPVAVPVVVGGDVGAPPEAPEPEAPVPDVPEGEAEPEAGEPMEEVPDVTGCPEALVAETV